MKTHEHKHEHKHEQAKAWSLFLATAVVARNKLMAASNLVQAAHDYRADPIVQAATAAYVAAYAVAENGHQAACEATYRMPLA